MLSEDDARHIRQVLRDLEDQLPSKLRAADAVFHDTNPRYWDGGYGAQQARVFHAEIHAGVSAVLNWIRSSHDILDGDLADYGRIP
jgi:hypothetical protein